MLRLAASKSRLLRIVSACRRRCCCPWLPRLLRWARQYKSTPYSCRSVVVVGCVPCGDSDTQRVGCVQGEICLAARSLFDLESGNATCTVADSTPSNTTTAVTEPVVPRRCNIKSLLYSTNVTDFSGTHVTCPGLIPPLLTHRWCFSVVSMVPEHEVDVVVVTGGIYVSVEPLVGLQVPITVRAAVFVLPMLLAQQMTHLRSNRTMRPALAGSLVVARSSERLLLAQCSSSYRTSWRSQTLMSSACSTCHCST